MIAFAKVQPARRVTLTQAEFSSAFQLLRTVGVSGGRSYHALDVASGNVVTVHLMDRDDTETQARLADRLEELPEAARDGLLVGEVNGIPLVVTQFVTALTPLRSWLDASVTSDGLPTTGSANVPSGDVADPYVPAVTIADEALAVFDDSPIVDIETLAPSVGPDDAVEQGQSPSPQSMRSHQQPQVENTAMPRMFVPPIDLAPPPPPPAMLPLPGRPRQSGATAVRPAPQIVSGPPGKSFIAPAAAHDVTFVSSIAGLITLGAVIGGAVYFMAHG